LSVDENPILNIFSNPLEPILGFNIIEDFQSNSIFFYDSYQEIFDSKIWINLYKLIVVMKYYLKDIFKDDNSNISIRSQNISKFSFDEIIAIFEIFNCLKFKNFYYSHNSISYYFENIENIYMKLFNNLILLINDTKSYVVNNNDENLQVSLNINIII
jgi:hypothetical protein